jgi:hypothetical protein
VSTAYVPGMTGYPPSAPGLLPPHLENLDP